MFATPWKNHLTRIEHALEWPMLILGLLWLGLFIVDMVQGLSGWWATASTAIWAIFIIDFVIKFSLAPHKASYLKKNWLTTVALAICGFGYVTATIASFFVGRDADSDEGEIAGAKSMQALRQEIILLRKEMEVMRREFGPIVRRSET